VRVISIVLLLRGDLFLDDGSVGLTCKLWVSAFRIIVIYCS